MTLDERTLELIHGELDGVIDAGERAELERLAASNPAVQRERDELRRLHDTLRNVEQLEPPPGMATAIIAGLDEHGVANRTAFARWFGVLGGSPGRQAAVVAAAAAVVAAIAWPMLTDFPVARDSARGTVGAPKRTHSGPASWTPQAVAEHAFVFDGAEGSLHATPAGEWRWTVDVELVATEPLHVELQLGSARLVNVEVLSGPDEAVEIRERVVGWSVAERGALRLTLSTERSTAVRLTGRRGSTPLGSYGVTLKTN